MKQAKLDQLFVLVVENVVDLAELQMTPAKLADPMARQAFKNTLMTGASRLSGQRLGALSSHKVLVAFILMVATGCIRFEHVQRSHLVRLHGAWVEFECSQGKARTQGARPGYHW